LGANTTLTVHDAPGARLVPQVCPCTTKAWLSEPNPAIIAGVAPRFLIVTDFGALVVPSFCGGKTSFWNTFGASVMVCSSGTVGGIGIASLV